PPEIKTVSGPVVFLAGPIQGAASWQDEAINYFKSSESKFIIANPRRSDETWKFQYNLQVDWETYYLERAGEEGVILFWLSKETVHSCERAYAQTTRFELAEWLQKFKTGGCKHLVLGIEPGFTGDKYIRRR